MLRCQFQCRVLKALFFIKITIKLSYFCKKKSKIFERWGLRPQTFVPSAAGACPQTAIGRPAIGLRRLGTPPLGPWTHSPPLRISGYAPVTHCCIKPVSVWGFCSQFSFSLKMLSRPATANFSLLSQIGIFT